MNPTLQHIVNMGAFFFGKARANQAESGAYQAARNLRKQGVPLPIALDVLARRPPRTPSYIPESSIPRGVLNFCD